MNNSFYIYGAGIVATSIYTAIRQLYNCSPIAFLVSAKEGNPSEIDGIPVWALSEAGLTDASIKCLIAVPEVHHKGIADKLFQLGIEKERLVFADNRLENKLMEEYYLGSPEFVTVSEILQCDESGGNASVALGDSDPDNLNHDIVVYQAESHVDKPLNNSVTVPAYIKPIQVGAALTDEVITDVRDNVGDNISHKNRNYCELTGTYYAWKNSRSEYKGLCHYRRIWDISEKQLQLLLNGNGGIDVILPYPSIHYSDLSGQHKRYVNETDWNAMLMALQEVAPEYYEAYLTDISKQKYFYNYNMLIAKKEIYDDYCEFLFSVLERTEELTIPKGWERSDRFAGYLGENLTTIYFRKNKDIYKIVHAGKLWLT